MRRWLPAVLLLCALLGGGLLLDVVTAPPASAHATVVTTTPAEAAADAARVLADLTGVPQHDVALVMGSGWLPAVDALGEATAEISTTDLPGFAAPAPDGVQAACASGGAALR